MKFIIKFHLDHLALIYKQIRLKILLPFVTVATRLKNGKLEAKQNGENCWNIQNG